MHRETETGWKKSTYSGSGNCVEINIMADAIRVRDTKHPSGPELAFTPPEWAAFIQGVRAGEFNVPQVRIPRRSIFSVRRK